MKIRYIQSAARAAVLGLVVLPALHHRASAAFDADGLRPDPGAGALARNAAHADSTIAALWHNDLESAMADAAQAYRPVFVLFSSPDCGNCRRLKRDVLSAPEVMVLLENFTRVEIDVTRRPRVAQQFQLRGVPTICILAADGRLRNMLAGYAAADVVAGFLADELNPDLVRAHDAEIAELLAQLRNGAVSNGQWSAVMLALGDEKHRHAVWEALLALDPLPGGELVSLLDDPRLAVRLGAIDTLEEVTGEQFGFDPWLPRDDDANRGALREWRNWAAGATGRVETVYMSLDPETIERHLQNLVGDNLQRSRRSMRILRTAGPSASEGIADFLAAHPELPEGAVRRIKEVQYALWLPDLQGIDAHAMAHHLTFGTLDMKLKALRRLRTARDRAVPVLRDFLAASEGIVRETAAESLLLAARFGAIELIGEHLRTEEDVDVIYAILRTLGQIRSKRGLHILAEYASHENEDLAGIALSSLGSLKSHLANDAIIGALEDPRWRVRVAALEAAAKLRFSAFEEHVVKCLTDSDGFVRHTAVKTLTRLQGDADEKYEMLKTLIDRDDIELAAVVGAIVSLNKPLPASLKNKIAAQSLDGILAMLGAMEDCSPADLALVAHLAEHENDDVACAVLRLIAARGRGNTTHDHYLVAALRSGNAPRVRTAVDALAERAMQRSSGYNMYGMQVIDVEATTISLDDLLEEDADAAPGMAEDSVPLDDLFAAFEEPAEEAAAPAAPDAPVTMDDLFSAFGADAPTPGAASEDGIEPALRNLLATSDDPDVRFDAALYLIAEGGTNALAHVADMAARPVEQRVALAGALRSAASAEADAVVARLLADPSPTVRSAACAVCMDGKAAAGRLALMLDELEQPDTPLRPYDIDLSSLSSVDQSPSKRKQVREWCSRRWSRTNRTDLLVAVLVAAHHSWTPSFADPVTALSRHDSPWVRRAAYYVLGQHERDILEEQAADIARDTSEYVRFVLPRMYARDTDYWTHYFDATHTERVWDYSSAAARRRLPEAVGALVRALTEDPSVSVRMEAYFCLLDHQASFDINRFRQTLDSLPDRKGAVERIAEYLVENYAKLGPGFAALLPYLDEARQSEEKAEKVFAHFGRSRDDERQIGYTFVACTNEAPVMAAFLEVDEPDGAQAPTSAVMTVVYFTSPGCTDCARVSALLARVRGAFPGMVVRTLNIKKTRAMLINEALCEHFNVPARLHLVTPAVFGAGGALVRHEVTSARLAKLLSRSHRLRDDTAWLELGEEEMQAAEKAITDRFEATGLWLVLGAGLLDGVNPCAFATIIFFLSYLQVTRRRPREILQVGIAFIAGVFLAYLGLGLGLHELVARLTILRRLGRALNWTVAGFAVVLAVLSLHDGVLCLRGRMQEMTLQLPGVLKSRIHTVIRRGARHRRFVVAAFAIGIAVSVLELACTGQVYLPTILFVLNQSGNKPSAVLMLLSYNLAFVAPLGIVFGLAWGGMRSETLTRFMQRHTAVVKFATALLFLALFLFFAFGSPLLANLSPPEPP